MFASGCDLIELLQDSLVETLTDVVDLRMIDFDSGMLNVIQVQFEVLPGHEQFNFGQGLVLP